MTTIQAKDGRWYKVRDWETCCDCGLCHFKEFKVSIEGKELNKMIQRYGGSFTVHFRAWRDAKLTEKNRKKKQVCIKK